MAKKLLEWPSFREKRSGGKFELLAQKKKKKRSPNCPTNEKDRVVMTQMYSFVG